MKTENRRWWALSAMVLSVLVVGLDATVLNLALPTLSTDLGASTSQLQWMVAGYTVVFGALQLPAGLLGDRYGRKRLMMGGLVFFGTASLRSPPPMPQNSKMTTPSSDQRLGLRERKKLKTRRAIQENAFRLFAAQGYEATTVEQIAEAAEVSPSTFFRYFPTKEDVVLEDDYDPVIYEAVLAQPADLSPLQAVRTTIVSLIRAMPPEELQAIYQRVRLSMDVPALRARQWENVEEGGQVIAKALAQRTGRPADDFQLRALTMALMGAQVTALYYWAETDGTADFAEILDRALEVIARGGELG